MDISKQTAAYIRVNYPPSLKWEPEKLLSWIRWAIGNGFLARILDDKGRVLGVGMARTIMKAEDGLDTLKFDPEGSIIFVDMCVTTHQIAMHGLVGLMRQRFGMRDKIAWMRRTGTSPIRAYSCQHFFNKLFSDKVIAKLGVN